MDFEDPRPEQWIEVAGIAGHFANINDAIQHDFARTQLQRFHDALETVKKEIDALPPFIHASCMPVVLQFGKTDFALAPVGISYADIGPHERLVCHGFSSLALVV